MWSIIDLFIQTEEKFAVALRYNKQIHYLTGFLSLYSVSSRCLTKTVTLVSTWRSNFALSPLSHCPGFSFLKLVGAQGTTHLTYATCVITAPKNFAPATYYVRDLSQVEREKRTIIGLRVTFCTGHIYVWLFINVHYSWTPNTRPSYVNALLGLSSSFHQQAGARRCKHLPLYLLYIPYTLLVALNLFYFFYFLFHFHF